METLAKNIMDELKKIRIDINIIKGKLDEGELTDWAKTELEESRNRIKKVSHEEVKKMILAK